MTDELNKDYKGEDDKIMVKWGVKLLGLLYRKQIKNLYDRAEFWRV